MMQNAVERMQDAQETIYTMALAHIPHVSLLMARQLYDQMGSACAVFEHRHDLPDLLPDASHRLVEALAQSGEAVARAEAEYAYAEKNHIRCLCLHDSGYPRLLAQCDDAPLVLFHLGNTNLNARRIVSIVGTRRITPYGKDLCRSFVAELQRAYPDTVIVSGLAYGVDINAHRAALDAGMATVGVLAHGLDMIYPSVHRATAAKMVQQGGLLTEYMSGTHVDRSNFVRRNRIVAGMSTATVIVESAEKGGALITARNALEYNREVCAFPGRITDEFSAGCNKIIARQEAHLIQSASDFFNVIGWQLPATEQHRHSQQQELFPEVSAEEKAVLNALAHTDSKQINQIVIDTNMPFHRVSALLFELEIKGLVGVLGGARYRLITKR